MDPKVVLSDECNHRPVFRAKRQSHRKAKSHKPRASASALASLESPLIFRQNRLSGILDFCNLRGPQLQSIFRAGATRPPHPGPDKRFHLKDKTPRGEGMMRAAVNRTKLFHVKHFGTIAPQTRDEARGRRIDGLAPRGAHPLNGAMFVLVHVSSMKTRRSGAIRL